MMAGRVLFSSPFPFLDEIFSLFPRGISVLLYSTVTELLSALQDHFLLHS